MDEESTPVSQQPSLWSDKSSSFDLGVNAISNPGDIITYTYHVTNNGKVTLSNVSINESSGQFTGGGVLPVPVYQSSSMGSHKVPCWLAKPLPMWQVMLLHLQILFKAKLKTGPWRRWFSTWSHCYGWFETAAILLSLTETNTPSDPAGSDPATTLIPPPPPVAVNDVDLDNMPGTAVVVDILNNDHLYNGSTPLPSTVTVTLIDPATGMPTLTPYTVTIPGQGSYVYNPTTGEITFTPVPGYTSDPDNWLHPYWKCNRIKWYSQCIDYLPRSFSICQWRQLTGQCGRNKCDSKPACQWPIVGRKPGYCHQYLSYIDWPATGMPTVYTKCSYHFRDKAYTHITLLRRFDLWSVWWLLLQILHQSVISLQKHWQDWQILL